MLYLSRHIISTSASTSASTSQQFSLPAFFYCLFILFSTAFISTLSNTAAAQGLSKYTMGSGDIISITVYEEEDLSMELRLSDTGVFNYPFLGDIKATGLTVKQLEQLIVSSLKPDYLINPDVTVRILEYRKFYIHGEVRSPAAYPFSPGLTLRKAVSLAGGFTARASKSKFFILSDSSSNSQLESDAKIPATDDKNKNEPEPVQATLNTPIKPGDIIKIEQSFF